MSRAKETVSEEPSTAAVVKRGKRKRPNDDVGENLTKTRDREPPKVLLGEAGVDDSIRHMDSTLLADHFAKYIKRHLGDLSTVELEDKYLPTRAFLDATGYETSRNLTSLPGFLEHITPGSETELKQTVKENGSPHTLLLTSSGIRAADITRSLRKFQSKDAAVAKLFAKHIKIGEAVAYLEKTRIGIGIGTPVRITDLLQKGALKVANLRRIVVDGSYVDQKKRSIFDMKELFVPLSDLLSLPVFKERYQDVKLEIIVF